MQEPTLTPTSYIVLGLLELAGEATPYDLKRAAADSVGNFWTMQHAQFYTEPEKLTKAGLLTERRETKGRRRRHYRLTSAGRKALDAWRATPTDQTAEVRDLGLLRLYFGADPKPLAEAQLAAHRAKLAAYQAIDASEAPPGPRSTLEAGIALERQWVRYWQKVARGID